MKAMQKFLWITLIVLATIFSSINQAKTISIANDRRLVFTACTVYGNLSPNGVAECLGDSYLYVLEQYTNLGGDIFSFKWLPNKGIAIVDNEFVLVMFQVDDSAVNFFKSKFMKTDQRIAMGMEIDVSVVDNHDVLNPKLDIVYSNIPKAAGLTPDTNFDDSHPGPGAIIRFPQYLVPGTTYWVKFVPQAGYNDFIHKAGNARLVFQLSANIDLMDKLIAAEDAGICPTNYSESIPADPFDYYVMKSNAFSEMYVKNPEGVEICWYGRSGDDIGCDKGWPFPESTINNAINGTNPPSNPPSPSYRY